MPASGDWPFAQRKPLGNELGGPTILQIDLCSWAALDTGAAIFPESLPFGVFEPNPHPLA